MEPGHRLVRTAARDVHVHICEAGSAWERRHLLFRDWLRLDPVDRERYQRIKQDLTRRDWPSMNDYAAAKSPIINDITATLNDGQRRPRWTIESSFGRPVRVTGPADRPVGRCSYPPCMMGAPMAAAERLSFGSVVRHQHPTEDLLAARRGTVASVEALISPIRTTAATGPPLPPTRSAKPLTRIIVKTLIGNKK